MADATHNTDSKTISRRNILKATGALIGAGTIAVAGQAMAGEPEPDAKLIALGEELKSQRKIYMDAANTLRSVCVAAETEYPEAPVRYAPTWSISPGIAEALGATFTRYEEHESAINAINKKHKTDAFEAVEDAQYDAMAVIEDGIEKTPAQTLAGMAIKLDVWRWHQQQNDFDGPYDGLIVSVLKDAKRLGNQT